MSFATPSDRSPGRLAPVSWLAPALFLLPIAPGCGDDDRVPLYPAGGRLEINGEPAGGVQVVLYPAGQVGDLDALRPRGTTGPDGSFTLSTYDADDGAPAGRYKVTLFWPDVPPGPTPPHDRLGGKYASPQASDIEVTIREGATTLDPLRLTQTLRPITPAPGQPRIDIDGMPLSRP